MVCIVMFVACCCICLFYKRPFVVVRAAAAAVGWFDLIAVRLMSPLREGRNIMGR